MSKACIKNAQIINEGKILAADILINAGRIEKIAPIIDSNCTEYHADGKYLLPGLIDDQVHFREPGLTHKATIATESRAAVAGGITSFMEMPNTVPNTLSNELLEEKYQIAANHSLANYSFFLGASNDNIDEVLKVNPLNVCGVKVFMGSSTGNILVDSKLTLESIFKNSPTLVATHCEDEATIQENLVLAKEIYGDNIPVSQHPIIRSSDACYISSSLAVSLAKKFNTRLHILHISTAKETELFTNDIPLASKKITAEACVHHLWFSDKDYESKGNFIKWNPAVKTETDRDAILNAIISDKIDVIATDHAPHTLEEKQQSYLKAPSGGPLVQHSLLALLDLYHQGKISLEKIVEKTSHNVATCFQITERGFIREGYWADLVLVDLHKEHRVNKESILYKCGWSPFEGHSFHSSILSTWVSGNLVYHNGHIIEGSHGQRLLFDR